MNNDIITVSRLTQEIRYILDTNFDVISVQGEISNLTNHRSGHKYFTLKDENAQISCVMWKSRPLKFDIQDGMKVIVTGRLTVYPARGSYQIDCFSIKPLGQGDLYLAFEILKNQLAEKGYFNEEHKKDIPLLPLNIGLSTSPTGAAIKDIVSTIERRLPIATIYFIPTLVQGSEASKSIVESIEKLQDYPLDVIIIGRGGGSIEDLWAYNEKETAEAIFQSKIPIVSGVGHETDFTIADFVADKRAATPTGAAEIITPITIDDLTDSIKNCQKDIYNSINEIIQDYKAEIQQINQSYVFRSVVDKVRNMKQTVDDLELKSNILITKKLELVQEKVTSLSSHLKSLNPISPLEKGFAMLYSDNKIIKPNETLGNFINIDILRKNEIAKVQILEIENNKRFYEKEN